MTRPSREYIYGINPAFEVVRAGRRKVYQAYLNQAARTTPRMRKLAELLDSRGIPVDWVEKGRVIDLAQSRDHQGVVLKTGAYPYVALDALLAHPPLLLLDNVEDPQNVGAILRSAEVFGFRRVLLPHKGTPDIYPSVVKVSAGATEFLDICKDHSGVYYTHGALDAGYRVVALDAAGTVALDAVPGEVRERMLLVIGGEDKAVGRYILNQASCVAAIPQAGRVNSLNASAAAAIAMYALRPSG
jgi:23S rRNA (guanosine2251-2'-O)-methyltransferase